MPWGIGPGIPTAWSGSSSRTGFQWESETTPVEITLTTVAPGTLASATVVNSPGITSTAIISPDNIGDATTVPTVAVSQSSPITVSPSYIFDITEVYYGPELTSTATVSPNFLAAITAVYDPVVTISATTVSPGTLAAATTVYSPVLTAGEVTVSPNFLSAATTAIRWWSAGTVFAFPHNLEQFSLAVTTTAPHVWHVCL